MANGFNPNEGGKVSKVDAEKWIEKYDNEHRKDKSKDIKSIFFGKDFINSIFANAPDAAGISIFFGKKLNEHSKKDDMALVLVPTTADGKLIWPEMVEGKDGGEAAAYDKGATCPPYCPQ